VFFYYRLYRIERGMIVFSVCDIVNYGTVGVCRIIDVTEREFGGESREFYVLKPVYDDKSTVYVPVGNQKLVDKMKRVLTAEEVYEMIRCLPQASSAWIEDERVREKEYRNILQSGSREEMVRMIKALHTHREQQALKGKKLRIADERVLKEAERILYDEFALVLEIRPDQVIPFIFQQLEPERKADIQSCSANG